MNQEEFKKLIESIGFKYNYSHYRYKEFGIDLYNNYYSFYDGSGWIFDIIYNDLTPINNYLKMELRSIKLKALLR